MEVIIRKAIVAIKMWGIGERKFWGDYKTRVMPFDRVTRGIFLYGSEIWEMWETPGNRKIAAEYDIGA